MIDLPVLFFFQYVTPLASRDGSYYITLWPFKQSSHGDFIHLAKMRTHPRVCTNKTKH